MRPTPIFLTPDLHLRIGNETARLTPTRGLRLAEQLIRGSARVAIEAEARKAGLPASLLPIPSTKRKKADCS